MKLFEDPVIRGKWDQLQIYKWKHVGLEATHDSLITPGCIACWMVRNIEKAILILDSLYRSASKYDKVVELTYDFLRDPD